jgi:dTDP-glucose 4,6-dehydratase
MPNVLVTGGAGFIGSHFACAIEQNQHMKVVIYDAMTYSSDLSRLKNYNGTIVNGDIGDYDKVLTTLKEHEITHIVNFAAESHVDRSIEDVNPFLRTNVFGTVSLMEAAEKYWLETNGGYKDKLFVHISTDEVYGELREKDRPLDEKAPLKPSNPYAASKAAADQFVIAKISGEGFPGMIVRSSNNFGLNQNDEKLIPKVIRCLNENMDIPLYGNGQQRRCWLYVEDYCRILMELMEAGPIGEIFNVKGASSLSNLEVVCKMREAYASFVNLPVDAVSHIAFVQDRKTHDYFYNIDQSKLLRMGIIPAHKRIEDFIDEKQFFIK